MKIKITKTRTNSTLYDTNGKVISQIRVKEVVVEKYIPKSPTPKIELLIKEFKQRDK